jgi:hypothetical protein
MIDNIFGREENTIEVCSHSVKSTKCKLSTPFASYTVDINPKLNQILLETPKHLEVFLTINLIDGDVTLHIIKIPHKRCMELVYQ